MINQEFIKLSERTEKKFPEGKVLEKDQTVMLATDIVQFVKAASNLDFLKKWIVYGKEPESDLDEVRQQATEYFDTSFEVLVKETSDEKIAAEVLKRQERLRNLSQHQVELLHHAIGMATESLEILQPIVDSIVTGEELDAINVGEELGDSNWYQAGLCRLLNLDPEKYNAAVIEKLKIRYPEKFNEESANVRDLDSERAKLEQGIS
jgi:hypothetical protein